MMRAHQLLCSCFGIGYLRGGGTFAAFIFAAAWYLLFRNHLEPVFALVLVLVVTLMGTWSSGKVEAGWGKDSSRVVIDEVAGMGISLLFLPVRWPYIITAFVLFRFFDILKPLYIRRLEKLPGGLGVMADDLLAGIYSNAIVQIIVISNLY